MANWLTHCAIADEILRQMPDIDRIGLVAGSIAPDCNVENADWTAFDPPREVTHFMTGDKKTSADLDGFRARYVAGRAFASEEERAFFLGYWAHLAADVLFMRFIRDEARLKNCFQRIRGVPEMQKAMEGRPETFDTLKAVLGKANVLADIAAFERACLARTPDASYTTVLPLIDEFPRYFDLLPAGAIARKIPLMLRNEAALPADGAGVFFTEEEYLSFLQETCAYICKTILEQ